MRTNSKNLLQPQAPIYSKEKKHTLLIPRFLRRRFLIQFVLLIIVGWIVGGITSLVIENNLLLTVPPTFAQQPQNWFFWVKLLSKLVFAVIFAADQALILRRYVSSLWWILATTVGWLISTHVSHTWISYIQSIAVSSPGISTREILFFGFVSTIAYIFSGVWLGLLQWLVLRRYAVNAKSWIFVPSISFFLISLSFFLLSLFQDFISQTNRVEIIYFIEQGLTALILGLVPGIGFCTLHRKTNRHGKALTL